MSFTRDEAKRILAASIVHGATHRHWGMVRIASQLLENLIREEDVSWIIREEPKK